MVTIISCILGGRALANRHPSVIKRHRQSIKRRARNRAIRTRIRSDIRQVREAVSRQDPSAANAELRTAVKDLSRAVSKGVLHRNASSRRIASLSRQVAGLKDGS